MKSRNALKQTYTYSAPSGTFTVWPPGECEQAILQMYHTKRPENASKLYSKCITLEATYSLCVARLFFSSARRPKYLAELEAWSAAMLNQPLACLVWHSKRNDYDRLLIHPRET